MSTQAPQHWSRIGEAGSVVGMRILLLVYTLFGRTGFRVFLYPVIAYFYLTRKSARAASREYLGKISATLPEHERKQLGGFKHFVAFGECLLDKLLVWMGRIDLDSVKIATPEVLEQINSSADGGIIVVSHLGNFEVCSALSRRYENIAFTMLVYTHHAVKFNKLLRATNNDANIKIMQVVDMSPATAMLLADRTRAGEFIAIAGDRTPVTGQDRTSDVDFLGDTAKFPQGAMILASVLKCPVYLMFCLKIDGHYQLYFERFAERLEFRRAERGAQTDKAVQAYANRLADYCRKAPLQWFNFYPFWQR